MDPTGTRILSVARGSAAARAGLQPGDTILDVGGHAVGDELALRFHLAADRAVLRVRTASGAEKRVVLRLPDGGDAGLEVEEFRTHTCNNACLFCFVDQLPPGVRPALRLKDDDYRLSFLHGNYVTLTNVPPATLDRIVEQRLSPLYVSVHATEPSLRARILGRKKADDLDAKLRILAGGGIELHTQVVLMPGINDGAHLERTVRDLYGRFPGVRSVAVVPVGLSDHGEPRRRLVPVTPEFSRSVVRAAHRWQAEFRAATGTGFVYLADEFYLQGGVSVPGAEAYDDFAQIEDGVGMVRSFLDAFETEMRRRRRRRESLRGTLVTGRLFAPVLGRCAAAFNARFGARLAVRAAENRFLGRRITVAGLLSGGDILAAVRGKGRGDFLIIPGEAVSRPGGVLLDDLTPEDLAARLGIPVYPGGRTVRDLFRLLFKI